MSYISIFIRSVIWRISRKLYIWARREASSPPEIGGEYWLLRQAVGVDLGKRPIFLDIGAYQGSWSEYAHTLFNKVNFFGLIYSFEPSLTAFSNLSERFKKYEMIQLRNIAMSDRSGEQEFFVFNKLGGTNSLVRSKKAISQKVITLKFDDFLLKERIEHVVFVKCDTEGHDFSVLLGATEALQNGKIDLWQFEYNHRWIEQGSFLKDVFKFIADKPYLIGKLYGNGIEIYDQWHPELERFFEANYVLIRKGSFFETLTTKVQFNNRNILVPGWENEQ